jgi:hypothetical protein
MHVHKLYVQNAFLHGVLKEEIFVGPPTGLNVGNAKVCCINKQAPMEWNKEFNNFIQGLGFKQSECENVCMLEIKMEGLYIYFYM